MKKNLITALIIIIVAVSICWCLKKTLNHNFKPAFTSALPVTNDFVLTSNLLPQVTVQTNNELRITNAPAELVISNFQTLAELKKIKSLHEVNGFLHMRNWYSESNLVRFQLKGVNGKSIGFTTDTMWALTDKSDDHVHELVLHSPWLDIDGVRQVGLELEKAWGLDPTDFLAWCNKVGNNWIDAPLYSAGNGFPPVPEPYIGFSVRRTTDNEKPWVIVLTIQEDRSRRHFSNPAQI